MRTTRETEETVLTDGELLKLTHSFKALVTRFLCWREEKRGGRRRLGAGDDKKSPKRIMSFS